MTIRVNRASPVLQRVFVTLLQEKRPHILDHLDLKVIFYDEIWMMWPRPNVRRCAGIEDPAERTSISRKARDSCTTTGSPLTEKNLRIFQHSDLIFPTFMSLDLFCLSRGISPDKKRTQPRTQRLLALPSTVIVKSELQFVCDVIRLRCYWHAMKINVCSSGQTKNIAIDVEPSVPLNFHLSTVKTSRYQGFKADIRKTFVIREFIIIKDVSGGHECRVWVWSRDFVGYKNQY